MRASWVVPIGEVAVIDRHVEQLKAEIARRTRGRRVRCCDAAVLVLRESKNPAVGSGDAGLCHMIAERAGMGHDGWWTEKKVLDNLSRQPGELVPRWFRTGRGRLARWFVLPEENANGYGVPKVADDDTRLARGKERGRR